MRYGLSILLTIMLLASFPDARSETLVREFSGSSSRLTPEFEVDGPWLLDWRLNGDYETMLAIDIRLLDGRTGQHLGQVLHTKRRGNGVKLFDTGGSYKLQIDSSLATWQIKIIQITKAEAELYTPRKDNK